MAEAHDTTPVAIVCGGGALPTAVADSLARRGRHGVLFAVRGHADAARLEGYDHHWIAVGQFGRLARLIKRAGCRDVVFIGSITRFSIADVRLDWMTVRILPIIMRALRGGDDHALRVAAREFEKLGFRLCGIREIAPDLLMPVGCMTSRAPDAAAMEDIDLGRDLLRAIGRFDVGQAAVVIGHHVVAVEDIEGTDALLARVTRLRREGRLRVKSGRGVLVKMPKTGQDRRLDLPAFGPKTVEGVIAAGLSGIAVAGGSTLVAEPQQMIALADKAGVFIFGMADEETVP